MGKSSISMQAENYAEVIVGQIAGNFTALHESIEDCDKLKEARDEYKKAKEQSNFSKFFFDKDIAEYIGYVKNVEEKTGRSLCDGYSTIEPLAVGLFGEWGSGKTHQLKLIKQNILYPPKDVTFPHVAIPIFFNAWRFEKEEHIILPLFETLLNTLEKYERSPIDKAKKISKSTIQHVKNIVTSLPYGLNVSSTVKTIKGLANGDVEDLAEAGNMIKADIVTKKVKEKTDDEQVGSQTIQELLKPEELRSIYLNIPQWIEKITLFEDVNFVFLIDDLDRCLPENTLKMLESIKLFLDVPSCAFVLAVDDDVVERGVVHHYRDYLSIYHNKDTEGAQGAMQHELPITGHEYLEKMIQLPMRLPVIDRVNVREFLEACSTGWIEIVDTKYESVITLDLESKKQNTGKFRKQSEFLLDFFSTTIPPKPRKIKRTALLFESKLKLLDKLSLEMDSMVLAKITLLELFAPKLLRFIQNNGYSSIFNALCHFKNVSYQMRSNLDSELNRKAIPIPDMEEYKNSLIEIDLIQKYIQEGINHPDFQGYTPKEKDLYTKLMQIVYEHYNSRSVFNLDNIFRETIEIEQLTRILELRDIDEKIIMPSINKKYFSDEFYQRLFRDGDYDAWREGLEEYGTLLDEKQLDELIDKATKHKDGTFNDLPFLANPQWVGEVAKYLDAENYKALLKSSHKARFKRFDDTNQNKQIDMFQLTFAEYDKYCDIKDIEKPKDEGWGRGRRPVINVSWSDAAAYIKWLNEFLDTNYTLPTEKEWELACNSGKNTMWHFGDDKSQLRNYAWYDENSENKTHLVGEKKPNGFGLYDMHGNAWEWCEDWYDENKEKKVVHGGSWDEHFINLSSSFCIRLNPSYCYSRVGFRLQRTSSL